MVIENGDYEKGLIVLGVDPEKERSVTPNLDLAEGRYIKEGAGNMYFPDSCGTIRGCGR